MSIRAAHRLTGVILALAVLVGLARPAVLARAAQPRLPLAPDLSCDIPTRIMPLGDSITRGTSAGITDDGLKISYRKDLWGDLRSQRYNIDFVGGVSTGYKYAGFDPDNEGHGGFTSQDIARDVTGWLATNPPDIVLLHIGTNDVTNGSLSAAGVAAILDAIKAFDPQVWVVLARIINRAPPTANTTSFNNAVEAVVWGRITAGDRLLMVDMEVGAGMVYALQPAGDLSDEVHPYHTGYSKMAQVWAPALASLLPACGAPSAVDDGYSVEEDSAARQLDVLVNDSGGDLTITSVSAPSAGGSASTNGEKVTYTPAANFSGTETFTYTVNNGAPGSDDTAQVTVTVTARNDPPYAANDTFTLPEDSLPSSLDVLANDTTAPDSGETLVIASVTQGSAGGSASTDGHTIHYSPAPNFNGSETFNYTINDGVPGSSDGAKVTVSVTPVNDPPTATADSYAVIQNTSANSLDVLANDTGSPDSGEMLVVAAVTAGSAGGSASTDGQVVFYTPPANFQGTETFSYTLGDGNPGSTDSARVTVRVDPFNQPPAANPDNADALEDTPLEIPVSSLAANDSPGEGEAGTQALTITQVQGEPGTHGQVSLGAGIVVYTPAPNYNGPASFGYTACDNGAPAKCDTAAVNVSVSAVNDPPNPALDGRSAVEDTPLVFSASGLVANDSAGPADESGQNLAVTAVSGSSATHGEIALQGANVVFTPDADFNGSANFTYQVCDDGSPAVCATGTVDLSISAVNDAPTFVKGLDQDFAMDSGPQHIPGWAGAISPGPADEAGQELVFDVSNDYPGLFAVQPAIDSGGDLDFTLAGGVTGSAWITVYLQDNGGAANGGSDRSAAQSFQIRVHPVNHPPTGLTLLGSAINENAPNGSVVGSLSTIDPDPGDKFLYMLFPDPGSPGETSFAIDGDRLVTNAGLDFETRHSYRLKIRTQDWAGEEYTAAFTITITDVNEPPLVASIADRVLKEGEALAVEVLAADPERAALTVQPVVLPAWLGLARTNESWWLTGTAPPGSAGDYTIQIGVSDGVNLTLVTFICRVESMRRLILLPLLPNGY